MDASAAPAPARRSLAITVFGVLVAAASALLSIVSFISLLMILTGGYGTRTADLWGFLTVVVAPPATFIAGIGLVMRRRWAYVYGVLALAFVLGWQAWELSRPAEQTVTTTVLPSGVRSTVYHGGSRFSLPLAALCAGLLGLALTPRVRREFWPIAADRAQR